MKTNPDNEIISKLKELKPIIFGKYPISRLGLFGSFAIGDYSDKSDIDILVEFTKPVGWEFFEIEDFLESIFNRKIDLVSVKALKLQLKDKILDQTIFI